MKKQLLFLFFLFVSTLSFAQSSLDSLRLEFPGNQFISNISVSPDLKYFAISSDKDISFSLFDYRSAKCINRFNNLFPQSYGSSAIRFSKNSRFLILKAYEYEPKIYDILNKCWVSLDSLVELSYTEANQIKKICLDFNNVTPKTNDQELLKEISFDDIQCQNIRFLKNQKTQNARIFSMNGAKGDKIYKDLNRYYLLQSGDLFITEINNCQLIRSLKYLDNENLSIVYNNSGDLFKLINTEKKDLQYLSIYCPNELLFRQLMLFDKKYSDLYTLDSVLILRNNKSLLVIQPFNKKVIQELILKSDEEFIDINREDIYWETSSTELISFVTNKRIITIDLKGIHSFYCSEYSLDEMTGFRLSQNSIFLSWFSNDNSTDFYMKNLVNPDSEIIRINLNEASFKNQEIPRISEIRTAQISNDGNYLALSMENIDPFGHATVALLNLNKIKFDYVFKIESNPEQAWNNNIEFLAFDNSNRYLLLKNSFLFMIFDIEKQKIIDTLQYDNINQLSRLIFSDSSLLLYQSHSLFNYNLESNFQNWNSNNVGWKFFINKNIVYSFENNSKVNFINLKKGCELLMLNLLPNNNWLVKLPNSPYYMCSKDASKMLHYVTPSLKVIGFEQLDPVYNRPDIVLDSIGKYFGNSDGGMIDEYRKSWEKRIDRLGLDKEKLGKGEIAVPNAEIEGADAIAYENKAGKHNIKVSANDPKYPLRRFNVFVNEVPLYGSAGVSIAHLKKQVWDTTVSVPLSVGENKIQVSVMNELGLENFKYPTYVNYTPDKEIVAKTYYIGIGVNEFKESSHNLKYCVKDVRDLAREFASENKNVDTLLFTDQQVTKENILALKDYLNKTGVNDKVIISCSSHGLLDDSLNFYLAMHDVDFNNPKARGLKYEALESLLDGIPARQKLLLLDACNSGENDKTEVLKQELQQKEKNMDSSQVLAARGVIIKLEEENKSNFKKMNELFVNVRNNTGSVIISAAGGQESALEAISVDGKTIENGAFTYSILECLKQNEGKELKVNALKQYAEKRVEEITNGKQKPTSRQETMEVDWGVR